MTTVTDPNPAGAPRAAKTRRSAVRARRNAPRPSVPAPRNAQRSRSVGFMKVLFPIVAFALVALVVAWPYMTSDQNAFRLGFAVLQDHEADDPSIVNARFHSTDSSNNPYTITADFARNLSRNTDRVDLEMPKADIALKDGTWLVMTADTGHLYRTSKTLDLSGSVDLFHDSGYEFATAKARVDLAHGIASGTVPVVGHGPFGTLHAQGFKVVNANRTIYFTGKSRVVLYPGPNQGAK